MTIGADGQDAGFADRGFLDLEFPARPGGSRGFSQIDPTATSTEAGFVTAEASTTGVAITAVKQNADNDQVRFTLVGGALDPGDTITITYNTVIPQVAGRIFWRYKTDRDFDGDVEPLGIFDSYIGAEFAIIGDDAAYIQLTAPADLVAGEAFTLAAVAFDRYGNIASNGTGSVLALGSTDSGITGLPAPFDFATTNGIVEFPGVAYANSGFQHIFDAGSNSLPIYTHFSYVHATPPTYRRFFGDSHFHTGTGSENLWNFATGDHRGGYSYGDQAYEYARDAARLDFASLSDHAEQMSDAGWVAAKQLADEFNTNGFTSFAGYEWTRSSHHHVVLYKDAAGPVIRAKNTTVPSVFPQDDSVAEMPELIAALEGVVADFMVVPHPMSHSTTQPRWFQPEFTDERYSRLAEFFSNKAEDSQFFELGKFVFNGVEQIQTNGVELIKSLQYAWGNSADDKPHMHTGVLGSSDNHVQQPGIVDRTGEAVDSGGAAVALATQNDRDGIWDALHERRTYGTTGQRIYLDFEVNGAKLGTGVVTSATRTFAVRAAGTQPLDRVELVRFTPDQTDGGTYVEIHVATTGFGNGGYTFENTTWTDTDNLATLAGDREAFYYLRVYEQPQPVGGCTTPGATECVPHGYALSTPIWVTPNDCDTNGIADLLDISNGLSTDCDHNFIPDTCELAAGSSEDIDTNGVPDHCEDCNTNGLPDRCDLDCDVCNNEPGCGLSEDCDVDGVLDECEPDCNTNGVPDDCDISGGTSADCPLVETEQNGIPDECDIAADPKIDCNLDGVIDDCVVGRSITDCQTNGFLDDCDVAAGTSLDCDNNGVPDECDPDCDSDGDPDACEIAAGSATDCGDEYIGIPDNCEISAGTSDDLDDNGLPDRCEDCNTNSIPDDLDISAGTSTDCDTNGVPDECQADCNTNGVADACECFPNDFDRDGDSDLQDYAWYQLCVTVSPPIGFNCAAFSDCNTNGTLDFPSLQEATTSGFTTSNGFIIQAGPGIPCFAPEFEPISQFAAKILSPSDPPPWAYAQADATLEVRRIDGTPVDGPLRPGSLYALHYTTEADQINFFMASIIAGSMDMVTLAASGSGGDWAGDENFLFAPAADTVQEAPQVEGFPANMRQTHIVINHMLDAPEQSAGTTGRLFNFKTERAGTFTVLVHLESMNFANRVTIMMDSAIMVTVAE